MANPHRGVVEVELDGQTFRLRFTLNALAEVENRLGLASFAEIGGLLEKPSVRSLRALLWGGLLHERPELTEQQVGAMDFDFSKIVVAVSQAIGYAFQRDEAGGAEGNGGAAAPAAKAGKVTAARSGAGRARSSLP